MENVIRLKKGLNIRMEGNADGSLHAPTIFYEDYAVMPNDYYGLRPKLMVGKGDRILAGSPLFYDKGEERIKICSPVSGLVSEIVYGPKRCIERIQIKAEEEISYIDFPTCEFSDLTREKVKENLLNAGLWSLIRQRPYEVIPNPDLTPRDIFISCFDTAPLAPDLDMIVYGREDAFQAGVNALSLLTDGKVHIGVHLQKTASKAYLQCKNAEVHLFDGPHPCGNVGIQIHHIAPINKGEMLWFVHPQDVIIIGRLFMQGKYDATKIVALAGSEVVNSGYYKLISGVNVGYLLENNLQQKEHLRVVSGNVLTGKDIGAKGYLGVYDSLISVIPQGDRYRFLGWITLGMNTFSFSKTFFSWIFKDRFYKMDTNLNGGKRAFVFTGEFEKVLPMDIYPLQLIKACITSDLEAMENLGIYEVAPEDFALCEYIDPSKTEIQQIIRQGLDLIREEMN